MEPFIWNPMEQAPDRLEITNWTTSMPWLSAGFTGRNGGVSKAPYHSLNLAYHVGDDPADVLENRRRLTQLLGYDTRSWTCAEQVHGTCVAVVREGDAGRGYVDRESAFQDTDGLVTDVPGVLLTSFYADCVPLYFVDPVNRAIGLAHAGWKGTVSRIAEVVIHTMEQTYGSRREDIRAAIGPSIGECCYEVDEKVMARVREALEPATGEKSDITSFSKKTEDHEKTMLNLKELNRIIMIKAGILPTHIECSSWCTSCNPNLFFSYREQGGTTGRMASWIGMKER